MYPIRIGRQFISGAWIDGQGPSEVRLSPFSQTPVWQGRWASPSQAMEALQVAKAAFPAWSHRTLPERIAIAKRFAEVVESRRQALNELIVQESGKPMWEADTETSTVIGKVANSIEAIHHRRSTVTEGNADPIAVTRFRPLGAMVVLGPFNLPAHLPGAHIVPALLAGNTIVFKPSEQTPGVGEFLAEAWQEAGLPAGVLNLVHGAADVAQALVHQEACDGVLFTGSYRVGKILHQALAGRPEVMLALELGGNNALVVHNTSSVDAAVYQIVLSAYITSGQRCTCARRLIMTDSGRCEQVLHRLQQVMQHVTVGDPLSKPTPFMGALISPQAANAMLQHQEQLLAQGAQPLQLMTALPDHPAVLSPGLLDMGHLPLADEEWFGPLLVVQRAKDLEHAIDLANQTRFGLSAGLIGDSVDDFHQFVHQIKAGIVNWNRQTTGASGKLPFGGIGASGNHRPSGAYAADYCSFPVASLESHQLQLPSKPNPGLENLLSHLA